MLPEARQSIRHVCIHPLADLFLNDKDPFEMGKSTKRGTTAENLNRWQRFQSVNAVKPGNETFGAGGLITTISHRTHNLNIRATHNIQISSCYLACVGNVVNISIHSLLLLEQDRVVIIDIPTS